MASKRSRFRNLALGIASIALIAMVGGTAFATGHSSRTGASAGVSKSEVQKIVKSYIEKHKAAIRGPVPQQILFGTDSDTPGVQTIGHIGSWVMQARCDSTGVSVDFEGTGTAFGTNTLGATNGGAGSSFQTFGGSISFGVGTGVQGSQTVELVESHSVYTVTYFENAVSSSPVDCDVAGYALKLDTT
jgi:hypothetical protein